MQQDFRIEGMSCAACAASVERAVRRLDGVTAAEVNLLARRLRCQYDPARTGPDAVMQAVGKAGFEAFLPEAAAASGAADAAIPDATAALAGMKRRLITSLCLLLPLMYLSMGHMLGLPLPTALHAPQGMVLYTFLQLALAFAIALVNRKFFLVGGKALLARSPNMDTLVALGAGAAMLYGAANLCAIGWHLGLGDSAAAAAARDNLYFEGAGMILTLVTVGKYLEERAKSRTGDAVAGLAKLSPDTAQVLRGGEEHTLPVGEILPGDILVIRPGERIPADGVVVEGQTAVDQSALTGESLPVDRGPGDRLLTASLNTSGAIRMRATQVGRDTTLARMIALVNDAGASKAPIARLADRVSAVFVPVVMAISLAAGILWLAVGEGLSFALSAAISVLVVSYPCALGLATPVAIMVGIGHSARHGILIKSAEALEALAHVDTVVLDKTGTLTEGRPAVTDLLPAAGVQEGQLLLFAAALESASEHPLARAVLAAAPAGELPAVEDFSAVFGGGIRGRVAGRAGLGGSARFLADEGVDVSAQAGDAERLAADGKTPLFFAADGRLLGIVAVADVLKPSSRAAVAALEGLGLSVRLLTGDLAATARAIGDAAGIREVSAEVLPADKAAEIRRLQQAGHRVAMVGDGVNDSPALATAEVGIAMGAGVDIAVDAADLVLMNDDLQLLPQAIRYSRRVLGNIRQNLFWAFFYNSLGIPIAAGALFPAFGLLLNPMLAAAAMSLSSVFVVTNALRLAAEPRRRRRDPSA